MPADGAVDVGGTRRPIPDPVPLSCHLKDSGEEEQKGRGTTSSIRGARGGMDPVFRAGAERVSRQLGYRSGRAMPGWPEGCPCGPGSTAGKGARLHSAPLPVPEMGPARPSKVTPAILGPCSGQTLGFLSSHHGGSGSPSIRRGPRRPAAQPTWSQSPGWDGGNYSAVLTQRNADMGISPRVFSRKNILHPPSPRPRGPWGGG